jgi:Acetyltransferases
MGAPIKTSIENYTLRFAESKDVSLILQFIEELAGYEKLSHEVVATEDILMESLFERKKAEVIIGEYDGKPVSFALFFHNFSTFLGKPGIYLEDLFVKPGVRGKGLGKAILSFLAGLTIERNCGRLDWQCLDWNEPSIEFYKQLGAKSLDGWTTYRVTGDALWELSEKF